MQDVFKAAILPDGPDVLRVRLRPLSLAHVYILMSVDNPFAIGGSPHLGHLAFAVQICTRTFDENQEWFRSPSLVSDVEKWAEKCRDLDFPQERDKFEAYMKASTLLPQRWKKKDKIGAAVKHPWPLVIAVAMFKHVGETRAWDMPLPLAMSYWSALGELNGDDSLMTEQEQAIIESAKETKE